MFTLASSSGESIPPTISLDKNVHWSLSRLLASVSRPNNKQRVCYDGRGVALRHGVKCRTIRVILFWTASILLDQTLENGHQTVELNSRMEQT